MRCFFFNRHIPLPRSAHRLRLIHLPPMTQRPAAPAIVFLLLVTAFLFAPAPAAQADTGIVGWIGSEHQGGGAGELDNADVLRQLHRRRWCFAW